MKYVINVCYGGFGLKREYLEELGFECDWQVDRADKRLIEMVETLGNEIADAFADLKVVEIPDDATDWRLDEYDGTETITYVKNGKMYDID